MVCDDDPHILAALSDLLTQSGYSVSTAQGHHELMARMQEHTPDLLILDVRLPERDGIWIAEGLQVLGSQVPVLFLTGYDSTIYRYYSPFVGAVGYMLKPVNPDALLKKIDAVMQKRQPASIPARIC